MFLILSCLLSQLIYCTPVPTHMPTKPQIQYDFSENGFNISFSYENVFHNVEMIIDNTKLFTRKLEVDGKSYEYYREHKLYKSIDPTAWGFAAFDKDNFLVKGIFMTDDGLYEYENGEMSLVNYNFSDIALELPKGRLRSLEYVNFLPDCYQEDNVQWSFKLGIVYEYGLYQKLSAKFGSLNAILQDLEYLFKVGRMMFYNQLNIVILVDKVIVGKQSDPVPLSNTCVNALGAFNQMGSWNTENNPKNPTGYNMFLAGDCFQGIVGVSYIGSLCSKTMNFGVSKYNTITIFHELGHGFGAYHTFPGNGLEGGGIMDYADGRYQNTVQFNPRNRNEICKIISNSIKAKCPFFNKVSTCGNHVLDENEQCECLGGLKKCKGCSNCKLTKKVECSTSTFVLGQSSQRLAVSMDLLSNPECCRKGKFVRSPKTLCKTGGACSVGKCINPCTVAGGPSCGFNENGCLMNCVYSGKCMSNDLFYMPNNTACVMPSKKIGKCVVTKTSNTCV
jgi:Metallo-peptidase family M12